MALALHDELKRRDPSLEIFFFCGGKAFDFLQKADLSVFPIPYFSFAYSKGSVKPLSSLLKNLKILFFEKKRVIEKVVSLAQEISPDLVICDFEYFLPRAARAIDLPVINIHHQAILTKTRFPVSLRQLPNYINSLIAVRLICHLSALDIIPSFFNPRIKNPGEKEIFIGPILRPEIIEKKDITSENFILVYVMDPSFSWIIEILEEFKDETFVVTGCDGSFQKEGSNIILKDVDPDEFLKDLKKCKAVIATAGHTLMSEVLYLGKPYLSLIQENQFEQYLNAFYLEKYGYGRACKGPEDLRKSLPSFLSELPSLENTIQKNFSIGNEKAVDAIIAFLEKHA